jgi:adenine deaminase
LANGSPAATVVSGLADARTPGLDRLMRSRQAPLLQQYGPGVRRFAVQPQLARSTATVVLGSKPNGLPPGIALHAEFRSLAQAGLKPAQVLRTAGVNVSNALGVGLQIGRLVIGGKADLVLVSGDPLANIDDTRKIAGVLRNGRFYSVIGLIERAENAGDSP